MDPKKSGLGRESRDSRDHRRERLDAAFQWAKELHENKRKELQKQGLSGKELERQLGSISDTADLLYRTQRAELDRRVEEKRKKLEQLADGSKKSSSQIGGKAAKEAGNLSSKFKEHLDEKRKLANHSKEKNETKTDRASDKPKQQNVDRNNVSDTKAMSLKDVFRDIRRIQQVQVETTCERSRPKKQIRGKDAERLECSGFKRSDPSGKSVIIGIKENSNRESEYHGKITPKEMAEIPTKEQFDQIQQRHSDFEHRKIRDTQYKGVEDYYKKLENNENPDKPCLVEKVENFEIHNMYEIVNGRLPAVSMESMDDVDMYLEKNPEYREQPKFSESYRHCKVYFDVRDDCTKTEKELAIEHNVSESTIHRYRKRELEPRLISGMRRAEENHIIKEWANSHILDEDTITKLQLPKHTEIETDVTVDEPIASLIESRIVKDSTSSIQETEKLGKEEIVSSIENMIRNSPESKSKVLVADLQDSGLDIDKLSDIGKMLQHSRNEIQESLKERLENIDDVRVGFVKGKLYVWTPESNQNDMISAWKNQYFYFNNRELSNMVDKAGTRLGLGETKFDKYRNLSDLAQQITQSSYNPITIKKNNSRILGEALHFQRDILGLRTKDFNGRISKVVGANGVGGINNPQLLEGKKLEVERTRLFAIIKSDGWVSHDGKVGYIEKNLDRFNIMEKNLQAWGDFKLTRYYDNTKRAYETKLPSPFWKALTFWGFSPGDKLIHNEGLPFDIDKLSPESIKTYLGELTPEDGNFHPSRGFSWSRSVVIDAGTKTKDYDFKSMITPELKDFIKDNTHDTKGPRNEARKELLIKDLQDIIDSPKSKEPDRAKAVELLSVIKTNPSKLLEDEAKMARRMTIFVETNPREIRYYPESGRISVYWEGRTCSYDDAEKWGILYSSNDVIKRSLVKCWLLKRRESVEKTKLDLELKGIPYDEWWL